MSEQINITVGTDDLKTLMAQAREKLEDTEPLMASLAAVMHGAVMDNFKNESGGGTPWPALAKSTQKRRAQKKGAGKAAGPMLEFDGTLKRRIYADSDDDAAMVAVNLSYAAIHHFGGTIKQSARPAQAFLSTNSGKGKFTTAKKAKRTVNYTAAARTIKIPARPYMVLNAAQEERLGDTVNEYLEGL